MTAHFFYRLKLEVKPLGQLHTNTIQFPSLYSRRPPYSHGIPNHQTTVKKSEDKYCRPHPMKNSDSRGQPRHQGGMAGRHASGSPQKRGKHVPGATGSSPEMIDNHFDELGDEPTGETGEKHPAGYHLEHICRHLIVHGFSFLAAATLCQDKVLPLQLPTMKEEKVGPDDDGRRIDRVLRKAFPTIPPGAIAGAIRRGEIRLNGKRTQNDARVTRGDTIGIPDWTGATPMRDIVPESAIDARFRDGRIVSDDWSIPLLQRTEDYLVVNKPSGLTTHGKGALDEIIRSVARREGWWSESMSFRPGPVHRLDRNTSGVQLFSLSTAGAQDLTEQLRKRHVAKVYVALVSGHLPRREECRKRIAYDRSTRTAAVEPDEGTAGNPAFRRLRFATARTRFFPLAFTADQKAGLVAAIPETGRTHQVRCHAAALGIPLLGDRKYGGAPWDTFDEQYDPSMGDPRYILHATLFATTDPLRVWTAPFASATYGLLRRHFGDLSSVEHRLNEILPLACTGCAGSATIRV